MDFSYLKLSQDRSKKFKLERLRQLFMYLIVTFLIISLQLCNKKIFSFSGICSGEGSATISYKVSLISMHGEHCQQKKCTPLCYQQAKLVHSMPTENKGYEVSREPGTQAK